MQLAIYTATARKRKGTISSVLQNNVGESNHICQDNFITVKQCVEMKCKQKQKFVVLLGLMNEF
jgi:hypothetical protein